MQVRSKLTYANVMATIAVFIALGGSSYAALTITGRNVPRNALTGADIKNLTGADVRNNSLDGRDIRNLGAGDFRGGVLPAGPQGAKGDKGDAGEPATRLFGYIRFVSPTTAAVQYGSGVTGVTRVGPGNFNVSFSRSLSGCVVHAIPGLGLPTGGSGAVLESETMVSTIIAPQPANDPAVARAFVLDDGGISKDTSFFISAFC